MCKFHLWCLIFVTLYFLNVESKTDVFSLWQKFPKNIFFNNTSTQPKCNEAFKNFLNLLENNDENALKMLDATAKIPSGILNGNVNQYGDFNECMEVPDAQYCLVEMDLNPLWKKPYTKYRELVHSFDFFRETFNDPGHRIPGFTLIRWGFCIPRQCSRSDLKSALKENFHIDAQIRPGMCQKFLKNSVALTFGDYIARLFFGIICLAVLTSSLIDFCTQTQTPETFVMKLLMSFSVKRNVNKFLEIRNDDKEIAGLHGIRALNALGLLLSHKSISLLFYPFMNRTPTILKLSRPWTILGKNAIVYTDSFMLLSGLLNANALLTDLNNGRTMKFWDKLINRIFRILPNLLALILFCTYILPSMGSGPLWPTVVTHHSLLCRKYMWRNVLFIHNYFGFENMCLTHTHQLGIDMQLFLVTPIFMYFIWNHRRFGFLLLIFMATASTILRFWVAYEHELNSVVYFGLPISKMFGYATLSYILPTHRATIYLMGVYLAYLLKFSKRDNTHTKIQVISFWCFFLPIFLYAWIGQYHMVQKNYVYNRLEGSLLSAFSPILWGTGVSFSIYAMHKNIAGWLGKFLCWRYFQIATKLSYALYLVQFPVFFYNVGINKHVQEYQPYLLLQVFETMMIFICSLLLVLVVEIPFQNIHTILFKSSKSTVKETKATNTVILQRKDFKSG